MTTVTWTMLVLLAAATVCAGLGDGAHGGAHKDITLIPVVETTYGPVQGYISTFEDTSRAKRWQGVRFGASTAPPNRFRPPQPPTPWKEPLNCTVAGKIQCPLLVGPDLQGSEDCLFLDVYAPVNATNTSSLDVMVWTHGGGYVIGDNYSKGLYDGGVLAERYNVVVVALNYRLSALGFLGLESMRATNEYNSTGGWGILDQRMGLEWVRDNVAAFGGNPDAVTLFGQSAGAFSVCVHLASRASSGLFHAAIMESGNCDSTMFYRTPEHSESWGREYANRVGCDGTQDGPALVACLEALPLRKVLEGGVLDVARRTNEAPFIPKLSPLMPWGPTIDGTDAVLRASPLAIMKAGKAADVPVIAGSNLLDGSLFMPMLPVMVPDATPPLSASSARLALGHFFNASVLDAIFNVHYVPSTFDSYDDMVANIMTDFFFGCSTYRTVNALAEANGSGAWHYLFVYRDLDPFYHLLNATHMSELKFVWGNRYPLHWVPLSNRDWVMTGTFQEYWVSLIHGSPNAQKPQTEWPRVSTADTDVYMWMDVPAAVHNDFEKAHHCQFWGGVAID